MIEVMLYRLRHREGTKYYNAMRVNGPGVDAAVFNWGPVGKDGQVQIYSTRGAAEVDKKLTEKKGRGYGWIGPAVLLNGDTLADIPKQINGLVADDVRRCWNKLPSHIINALGGSPNVTSGQDFAAEAAKAFEARDGLRRHPPKPAEPEKPSATRLNPNYGMFA